MSNSALSLSSPASTESGESVARVDTPDELSSGSVSASSFAAMLGEAAASSAMLSAAHGGSTGEPSALPAMGCCSSTAGAGGFGSEARPPVVGWGGLRASARACCCSETMGGGCFRALKQLNAPNVLLHQSRRSRCMAAGSCAFTDKSEDEDVPKQGSLTLAHMATGSPARSGKKCPSTCLLLKCFFGSNVVTTTFDILCAS
mmetsp:Transcript_26794/g.49239  ORF Transcript_26794/g.49239 Transcript_26794/m.49239 type:complete len:202 (-) Transcript_26794:18-623(-)